jgi:hypothetical protein
MRATHFESGINLSLPTESLKIEGESMDATYNLSGGFKPTTKRFADLDGPDFFQTSGSHSIRPAPSRKVRERPLTLGSFGTRT